MVVTGERLPVVVGVAAGGPVGVGNPSDVASIPPTEAPGPLDSEVGLIVGTGLATGPQAAASKNSTDTVIILSPSLIHKRRTFSRSKCQWPV